MTETSTHRPSSKRDYSALDRTNAFLISMGLYTVITILAFVFYNRVIPASWHWLFLASGLWPFFNLILIQDFSIDRVSLYPFSNREKDAAPAPWWVRYPIMMVWLLGYVFIPALLFSSEIKPIHFYGLWSIAQAFFLLLQLLCWSMIVAICREQGFRIMRKRLGGAEPADR